MTTQPTAMIVPLAEESGEFLTSRWHDQSIDVDSIKFHQAEGMCFFSIREADRARRASVLAWGKFGLFKTPLQRSLVTVKNVAGIELSHAEGEVELFIVDVQATPGTLSFRCTNGSFEIRGQALQVCVQTVPIREDEPLEERTLSLGFAEISWLKKPKPRGATW